MRSPKRQELTKRPSPASCMGELGFRCPRSMRWPPISGLNCDQISSNERHSMASISKDPHGFKRIVVKLPDGRRKPIRIGKRSMDDAMPIKLAVEDLARSKITGRPLNDETIRWLTGVRTAEPKLFKKLIELELVATCRTPTLDAFCAEYIGGRKDLKPLTKRNLEQARKRLVNYFGAERLLRDISPGDADLWRIWLAEEGLSEVTIRRECGRAKQFLRAAIKHRLLHENPFADLKSTVLGNPDRQYFVTVEEAAAVLKACPDRQWRLLFLLARFLGVRVPSEALAIRWGDVDWEKKVIRVPSPKTERYEGKAERFVPLFPELEPELSAAFAEAPEGSVYVISKYRNTEANLRTQFLRIIRNAGLEPWEKPFQNCRSTRQTELEDQGYPSHVVAKWIGNSVKVARESYLQEHAGHLSKALGAPSLIDVEQKAARKAARAGEKTACNAMQSEPVTCGIPAENAENPSDSQTAKSGEHPRRDSNSRPAD